MALQILIMFTGIIQEVGTVSQISEANHITTLLLLAPQTVPLLKIGDSVSVDGSCLTVVKIDGEQFYVEAIPETLRRTVIGTYHVATKVNLEPAMQMVDRFHGHFVSGHIDFVSQVIEKSFLGDSAVFTISYPEHYGKYLSIKGSVTLNGVSLTISKIEAEAFEVSIIPHTLAHTNFSELQKGQNLNVEIDLIARYLETLVNNKEDESNYFFLKERGFI